MSKVLVDTSIWIDFFRGDDIAKPMINLIENGRIVTNDLVLAELIPSVNHKNEQKLKDILLSIERVDLQIDWEKIFEMQTKNLANGFHHVGIPDLIIAQNAINLELLVFENDKHFHPMVSLFGLRLFRTDRL